MAQSTPPSQPVVKSENYVEIYANSVEVGYTDGDFQIYMMDHTTDEETNEQIIRRKARIIMSPENTKRFSDMLQNMLVNWFRAKQEALKETAG